MIEKFKNIFTGLDRAHGVTYVDKKGADGQKIKGKSFVTREYVTDEMWSKHLQGTEPSLGIIPITDENTCKWGCVDIDSYAGFDHKKLIDKIKTLHLPLLVFRSKSGGAHVFLFTSVAVEAKLMRDKLLSISAVLGYGGSEVFPKQVELKSQDDTGNFLNLPYFNGDKTTRYCFNDKGEAVNLAAFYLLHDLYKITPDQLEKLIIKRPESEFSDGPPCLESLTQTDIKDGRDRILYQYIQYAKRKWPENWQSKINAKPPRITVKEFEKYTDMLLQGVEEVEAPVGSSRIDQLSNHLEDYCLQRSIGSVSKKDILNGAVYTESGKHVFTFHRFFHGHLTKKKWKEDYQVTQQMLKEHCGCEEGRMVIGKKKPSIMKVDIFEKPDDQFTQKKLKEEDPY
jgi:hypothetical protein